jgi:guanylate kinase
MRKRRKGLIFVVSAPSGSGKTTLCKRLIRRMRGLVPSVSATTRRPRRGEKNRQDYFYLSEKAFRENIRKGEFLEWTRNFGYYYGTPRHFVIEKTRAGKDLLLSIDVKGAMQVKKKFPGSILIFIKPPSFRELSHRLGARGLDEKAEIAKRLKIAKKELAYIPRYDYAVVNDRLEDAVTTLKAIVKKERSDKGG